MAKQILLVEENNLIRLYLKQLIEPFGYELVSAVTLAQVQQLYGDQGFDTAVIAIDIQEEAEEIIKYLTELQIPTILLTGIEDERTRDRLLIYNVISILNKNTQEDLQLIVKQILHLEAHKKVTILVVEDSLTARLFIVDLLKSHNFKILEAKDGIQALKILTANRDIKIILTDYEMPNMNGLELIKEVRLKKSRDEIPIIVISSQNTKNIIVDCLRNGANDYLSKPFEREEFFKRIYLTLEITERTDAMREQTDLLKSYQETIDKHTLVSIANKDGIITYISTAYEKLSGYSKQEVIGQTHAIFRHPDTHNEFYISMWQRLLTTNAWDGEVKNRRKDGSDYWMKLHIEPEKNAEGEIVAYSSIGQDITDTMKLKALTGELESRVAEEIEKNNLQATQMIQQARLAQMGEMISMIAHQWRQPLASVSAIASTLRVDVMMDNYKQEFFEERLESISDLSQHLSSTIDDFREFFKPHKEKRTESLQTIIQECFNIITTTLNKTNIKVIPHCEVTPPITSYINEIKQVVLNILKNAEDALMEFNRDDKYIEIRCYGDEMDCYITIEDNAGGIPDAIIEKIFDPYFSTKKQKDGTGLGLYMSKTIIEEHCGGTLRVENGEFGACFTIVLPLDIKDTES